MGSCTAIEDYSARLWFALAPNPKFGIIIAHLDDNRLFNILAASRIYCIDYQPLLIATRKIYFLDRPNSIASPIALAVDPNNHSIIVGRTLAPR